jgi:uncharacterized protein (DUF58 family)
VTHTDPFGAVRRRQEVAGASPLLVYPAYEEVTVLPSAVQRIGIIRHSPLVGHGDEFYALRAYEEGDDLRKVHWPSSLRKGELVIRQEELLAEPRALIVLDTTQSKHKGTGAGASLEAAVSAAASIGILSLRRRMRIEVVTNDGPMLQTRHPTEEQLLEGLALVTLSRKSIGRALDRSFRPRSGRPALIVVITPDLRREDVRSIALRSRNSAAGAIVWIDANSFEASQTRKRRKPAMSRVLPFPVVPLHAGDSFRSVWHTAIKDVALAR